MLRQVLPPLVTAYVIFVAMVVLESRRPVPRPRGILRTVAGGYLAFLAIVLLFHVWLAEESDAFASAAWGGAFLSGITVLVAFASSLIERRR